MASKLYGSPGLTTFFPPKAASLADSLPTAHFDRLELELLNRRLAHGLAVLYRPRDQNRCGFACFGLRGHERASATLKARGRYQEFIADSLFCDLFNLLYGRYSESFGVLRSEAQTECQFSKSRNLMP